ncbi:MAG: hypothetical protein KBS81_08330 [Spirochaetales bacterium]|nr:hypothetical protein [Candidatus Physcosoma equi]
MSDYIRLKNPLKGFIQPDAEVIADDERRILFLQGLDRWQVDVLKEDGGAEVRKMTVGVDNSSVLIKLPCPDRYGRRQR